MDDVRDGELPTRLEHPGDLGEDFLLLGRQVDDAVADHPVHRAVFHRHLLDDPLAQIHIVGSGVGGLDSRRGRSGRLCFHGHEYGAPKTPKPHDTVIKFYFISIYKMSKIGGKTSQNFNRNPVDRICN